MYKHALALFVHQLTAHWIAAFIPGGIRIGSCDQLKGFAGIFGLYEPYIGTCLYDVIRRMAEKTQGMCIKV